LSKRIGYQYRKIRFLTIFSSFQGKRQDQPPQQQPMGPVPPGQQQQQNPPYGSGSPTPPINGQAPSQGIDEIYV
jgi:hypothetical protein